MVSYFTTGGSSLSDLAKALNFTTLIYNFRLVTVTFLDQYAMGERFYMGGDKVKFPMWYARFLHQRGFAEINELNDFGETFNTIISTQSINHHSLVRIEPDFYFMLVDYLNLILRNNWAKLRKLRAKINIFMDIRKIVLAKVAASNGYDRELVDNMSFEECVVFGNLTKMFTAITHPVSRTLRMSDDPEEEDFD